MTWRMTQCKFYDRFNQLRMWLIIKIKLFQGMKIVILEFSDTVKVIVPIVDHVSLVDRFSLKYIK